MIWKSTRSRDALFMPASTVDKRQELISKPKGSSPPPQKKRTKRGETYLSKTRFDEPLSSEQVNNIYEVMKDN
jgi:hypothetical protein